jgi:hypothetical protein
VALSQASAATRVLVLLSMFAAVAMMLCSKRLVERYDALYVTATTIALGTIMIFIWVVLSQPLRFHFSLKTWTAVLAQGLLATAGAYLCWNWGLAHIPASRQYISEPGAGVWCLPGSTGSSREAGEDGVSWWYLVRECGSLFQQAAAPNLRKLSGGTAISRLRESLI